MGLSRGISKLIYKVFGSRGAQVDDLNPEMAIKALPKGYGQLKKKIDLFGSMSRLSPLMPTQQEISLAKPSELIVLGAIYAEAGMWSDAAAMLDRAGRYDRRYLSLTRAGSFFSDEIASRYRTDLDALDFLEAHEGLFADLIVQNKGSICVVGNSPCEKGRENGQKIDEHAVVIRFNNFSTSLRYATDYGTKCDVWSRLPGYSEIVHRTAFTPLMTITRDPLKWRIADGHNMAIEHMKRNAVLVATPIDVVWDLYAKCGAAPSSGLMTLAWIRSILGSLSGVSVYGFSLNDQKDGVTQYFMDRPRAGPSPHDWDSERKILDHFLLEANS